jgi:hypothetical protein
MSAGQILANVVDDLPGNLRQAVFNELKNGHHKEMVQASVHSKRIAQDTHNNTFKSVEGLGRLRMRLDPKLYHYWGTKLGYGCWRDAQFLREVERDNPEVRVKCGGTKMQFGFSGQKKFTKKYTL